MKKAILKIAFNRKPVTSVDTLIQWWEGGKDFSLNGRYCSNRDFEYLKKEFDIIELVGYNTTEMKRYSITIWTHPLAGITSYV